MTSTENHHKHPPLPKPSLGEWGRNEFVILGAPCPVIKKLAEAITAAMSDRHNVGYVDADHANTEANDRALPFNAIYTDKITSRRIDLQRDPTMFERRAMMSSQDLILVNGNHFTAKAQIVLLHSKKMESLQRKTDRLTNVAAVLEIDTTLDACPFLNAHMQSDTKVFNTGEEHALIAWLSTQVLSPSVNGLVLAGGKSIRMGRDKAMMEYHGMPHRDYLLHLLTAQKVPAYVSCRADQVDSIAGDYPLIVDRFEGLGPYGAILSAMMTIPDHAWLIIATDLPFVTETTLEQLLSQRNPAKLATAFHNTDTGFPEPLITLWEPKAYPLLLSYLAQGNICPRKALINSDVHIIEARDPNWLMNVNTPEELEKAVSFAKATETKEG
jgi:molybdopterin-guanine dinucleotide biosynthesis protein A